MRFLAIALLLSSVSWGCVGPAQQARQASLSEKAVHSGFDAELSGYSYPFPVHFFEFQSQKQKLKMAYMDESPAHPNGRAVLLLHGKNFPSSYWEPTMRLLLGQGYRVIAPDQIGFGKSSKPASYQFSFQALAQNTRALLDSAGAGQVSVVGHSMGGMLATRFSLLYPERVQKLVLVNPIGLEDWKTVVPYHSVDQWFEQELKATPDSIRAYQRQNYYAGQWKPEYEKLIEASKGWVLSPDYPRVAWCSALTSDMIFTQPVLYEFPRLTVPTLLIIGQRDRTALGKAWVSPEVAQSLGDYPTLGRRAASLIARSRLVELAGIGHLPQVEAFAAYANALTEFLP